MMSGSVEPLYYTNTEVKLRMVNATADSGLSATITISFIQIHEFKNVL